ncbi:hypothetical protein UlMin_025262 [Ulmus minor]
MAATIWRKHYGIVWFFPSFGISGWRETLEFSRTKKCCWKIFSRRLSFRRCSGHFRINLSRQPNQEEGSTFAEFHTLFVDIQNLLKENTSEKEALSSSQDCLASLEEVSHAKKVLNECFSLNFANVMQTGQKIELKNALSTMCHVFADTKMVAVEVTKFVADFDQNCERYVVAQEDLEEAKEKENLVVELKTSLKQLYDVLIPVLDRAKEIEREIAKLERKLGERKAMEVQIKDDLEGLAGRASSSKQALIDAEQEMKLFVPKKEQAQTMIDDIEKSWKSFKSLSSCVLQYTF